MNLFSVNLVLALVWTALTDSFTVSGFLTGYAIGLGALWLTQPLYGETGNYFMRSVRIVELAVYFVYDLVVSSLRVTWDVITPQDLSCPKIIEVPLQAESDLEILLVTNLISLTPGTLSLDVSPDRKTLFVHAMFAEHPEEVIEGLQDGMEYHVRRVFTA
ncbi:MAG: Na+/H+ antiporter subunit E [Rhodobacteraceae bacterium]|nr:Na+/H+ antiporter subunit E [Paracoccaceae bacterium]